MPKAKGIVLNGIELEFEGGGSDIYVGEGDMPEGYLLQMDNSDNRDGGIIPFSDQSIDRESIVQEVIAALGTPVFGTVDGEKNIILSGVLAAGTYTVKYENEDGSTTQIGTITV